MSDNNLDPRVQQVRDNMLYLDDDSDDKLLSLYVNTADRYVRNAIGTDLDGFYDNEEVKPLFTEAVLSLAATFYQNRLAISAVPTYNVDLTVNRTAIIELDHLQKNFGKFAALKDVSLRRSASKRAGRVQPPDWLG